jgi:uncharacterized protein
MERDFVRDEDKGRFFRWGSWAFLVLAVFLAVQTLGAVKGLRNDPAYNTVSISGEGEVTAVPDIASVSFSVTAEAKDVSAAQAEVKRKMDAILSALKEAGIEDKDIKTSDYSVWPKYTYSSAPCSPTYCPPSRQIQDGYTASHNVMVKIRKTEEAGKILGLAGDRGATNISNISFTIDDPDALYEEARSLAIANAKSKAKVLAKELGVRLVKVVSYSDSDQGQPYNPMPYMLEGRGAADQAKEVAPNLPQGENTIRVMVNVVYEIR